jgi:Nif-specific regulatory protein
MAERSSEPRLVAVTGLMSGEVFALDAPEVSFGRDTTNTICVPDPALSRRHCLFQQDAGQSTVRDLGSSNGTFVNGCQIADHALAEGDRLVIGGSVLLFVQAAPAAPPNAEMVDADVMAPTTRLAIEDARYLRQTPRSAVQPRVEHDLRALLAVSTVIHAVRSERELHAELLRLLRALVPADSAAVVLTRGDGQMEIVDDGIGGRRLQVSRAVVSRVVAERAGLLSRDVAASRSFTVERPGPGGTQSLLCVPIAARDTVLGVFYLLSNERAAFDDDHLELVTAVGHLAAIALENVRQLGRVERDVDRLHADLQLGHVIVGDSPPMQAIADLLRRVARTDTTVLITGESGTGKELAARTIHLHSPRARRPFVTVNCAALTETLVESELFGHERGAFTHAVAQKKGRVELADSGTLFLDEIAELPASAQSKLLRVLQEREFERVGGVRTLKADIRLVAATNRDLATEIRAGRFRDDLYFRLNVVAVEMPPLRERRGDIERLAGFFLERYIRKAGRRLAGISAEAMAHLCRYDWPGNVRELANAIERAVVLGSSGEIRPEDLPEAVLDAAIARAGGPAGDHLHSAVMESKKKAILEAMRESGGSFTEAARRLGVHPNYLHRLVRNLGLRAVLNGSA